VLGKWGFFPVCSRVASCGPVAHVLVAVQVQFTSVDRMPARGYVGQLRCRREAQDAHASLGQEHQTAVERLRAGHEAEVVQLAEQIIQLEARLQRATADAEQHASSASALQERLEQQEGDAKAAADQVMRTIVS
jgi:Skp family chaperone for outer membrane proteins